MHLQQRETTRRRISQTHDSMKCARPGRTKGTFARTKRLFCSCSLFTDMNVTSPPITMPRAFNMFKQITTVSSGSGTVCTIVPSLKQLAQSRQASNSLQHAATPQTARAIVPSLKRLAQSCQASNSLRYAVKSRTTRTIAQTAPELVEWARTHEHRT